MPLWCIVLHMGMLKEECCVGVAGRSHVQAWQAGWHDALCALRFQSARQLAPQLSALGHQRVLEGALLLHRANGRTFRYLQSTSCSVHYSPPFKFCSTKKEKVGSSLAPEPCRRQTAAA